MLKILCKSCNTELISHPVKTRCCGCNNMTTIKGENISANNLSLVEIVYKDQNVKSKSYLSKEDIEWQELRRSRNIKKMEFEIK